MTHADKEPYEALAQAQNLSRAQAVSKTLADDPTIMGSQLQLGYLISKPTMVCSQVLQ